MNDVSARGLTEPDAAPRPLSSPLTPRPLPPDALMQRGTHLSMPADEGYVVGVHHRERRQANILQCATLQQAHPAPVQVRPRREPPVVQKSCPAPVLVA